MTTMPKTAYALAVEGAGLLVAVDAGTPVTPALLLDALRQVLMLPPAMTGGVLWDLRAGAADRQLDADAVVQIAAYVRDRLQARASQPRMAFVVDRDRGVDLPRTMALLAETLPCPAAMFRSRTEALAWLAKEDAPR